MLFTHGKATKRKEEDKKLAEDNRSRVVNWTPLHAIGVGGWEGGKWFVHGMGKLWKLKK